MRTARDPMTAIADPPAAAITGPGRPGSRRGREIFRNAGSVVVVAAIFGFAVPHFFNSLHLWSVELFMALLVIHLWGKFWMAAWRGRRTLTWITGAVAFVASVLVCFTEYLSQQNFDSQWIATNG